ncbi:MAG: filamentous hemagglutinin N-terminal domain-containing protein, partial [Nitrospirales bacterium]
MTRMASLSFLQPRRVVLFGVALSLGVFMGLGMSQAQTTNITSSGLGTDIRPPVAGTTSIVGGTTAGTNLFHSFGNFSIGVHETARFAANNGQVNNSIDNIISRVTGTNPSSLFGTLDTQSNFPTANFFLVNPNGIVFGPNATLIVGGSFAASTADYLKLTDGVTFYANPALTTVLSIAPVAAFGFTSLRPANISVQGSSLQVPTGATLALVGGDLTIQGDAFLTGIPTLDAPSGNVVLGSVASRGEALLGPVEQGKGLQMEGFSQLGRIIIAPGSLISTAGESGGTVVIRGGQLTVDGSFIFSDTLGKLNGAPLAIDAELTGATIITASLLT